MPNTVRCACLHTCQKNQKPYRMVSRRTREAHETKSLQESLIQKQIDTSTSPRSQVNLSNTVDSVRLQAAALLMDHTNALMSSLSVDKLESEPHKAYQIQLRRSLMIYAGLLHTTSGLSRTEVNNTLRFLKTFQNLNAQALNLEETNFPLEIRTILNHLHVVPILYQSICCPTCFTQYSINDLRKHCVNRETSRSRICGSDIRNSEGKPIRLYSTQSLTSWIAMMMQLAQFEKGIQLAAEHVSPLDGSKKDVWDSELWSSVMKPVTTPQDSCTLAFSLFEDGFNPFGNKTAGKYFNPVHRDFNSKPRL